MLSKGERIDARPVAMPMQMPVPAPAQVQPVMR